MDKQSRCDYYERTSNRQHKYGFGRCTLKEKPTHITQCRDCDEFKSKEHEKKMRLLVDVASKNQVLQGTKRPLRLLQDKPKEGNAEHNKVL